MAVLSLLVPVAFFGDARFKVASAPLVALLAGLGIARATALVRTRGAVSSPAT
jgi:asparagine N-glycosylation enzyme membrane subunit Stt3